MEKEQPTAVFENLQLTFEQEEKLKEFKVKWSELITPENWDLMFKKAGDLREKYPEYKKYTLYEALIGSTPLNCEYFDFPEPDSLERFINDLYASQNSNHRVEAID